MSRQRGDRIAADAAIAHVFAIDELAANDPWWDYLRVQARDAGDRLERLRRALGAGRADQEGAAPR